MRKVIGVLIILLFACTQSSEKPQNLVSEEKMALILSEILIYQQSNYAAYAETDVLEYEHINSALITSHGVSTKDFEESYTYYVGVPDLYNKILLDTRSILESKLPEEERIKREKIRSETEK